MKIFVAYGYNEKDKWIPELVFPIISAFGDEVITGEELQGQPITNSVKDKIRRSDALIGFATRRGEPNSENQWDTHRWVTDEISQAIANNLTYVLEIRETGVDPQGGIGGDRQVISYDEIKRDKCLVDLVKTLGRWHQGGKVKLQLLPDSCVQEIRRFLSNPNLRCTYKLLYPDASLSEEFLTTILPIKGGLFINAQNVQSMSLIQVCVECNGKSWTSDFENTDSFGLNLLEELE
jgi:hypothetical protein